MKRFNNIMDKYMEMNFFKRFLIVTPIFFIFISVFMWFLLGFTFPEINVKGHKANIILELSSFLSVIFGFIVSAMYGILKQSKKFWDAAHAFEAKIEAINNKNELQKYYKAEVPKLQIMASGNPHYNELNRLYSIVSTKYKYMCDNTK